MTLIRSLSCLILLLLSPISLAQLDSRGISGLEARTLGSNVPLAQDQAFPYYVSETGPGELRITWNLAPEHYLYRHAFQFTLQGSSGAASRVLEAMLPDGLHKTDQFFGDIEAYYGEVSATLQLPAETLAGSVLLIEYQGCADWGFCYPPQRREFALLP